ncbi:hypothetical protein CCAX7_37250 [Capsulimonas corticalis]|uniref:Uncharacterized protein n=1 Tax=Capsulimonas corticalis TaxID=2219043 RepID=A0A9N7QB35_9BACT|nr:hypothetical protein CCAX7_37250 [Capsulimonas corticalis]
MRLAPRPLAAPHVKLRAETAHTAIMMFRFIASTFRKRQRILTSVCTQATFGKRLCPAGGISWYDPEPPDALHF